MKKRKTTSIALAAAVAISTVKLAYPANVFAQEQVNNVSNNKIVSTNLTEDFIKNKSQERLNAINENEKFSLNINKSGSLQSELEKMNGYSKENVKSLTISTSSGAALNEDDFKFMREELVNLTELNLENADCIDNEGEHKIPKSAMAKHKNITKVVLPTKNVYYISDKAFQECDLLSSELVIPSNIKFIGNQSFSRTGNGIELMKGLVLSEGVEKIMAFGFLNNRIDGSLKIPSSMQFIGYQAFKNCRFNGKLEISKGSSLSEIAFQAFYGCDGFTGDLDLSETKNLVLVNGTFLKCTGLTGKLILPDTLKEIGPEVFKDSNLSGDLNLPDSLKKVGDYAFNNAKGFTKLNKIPSSLNEVGSHAFFGCENLKSDELVFPNSVTKIGDNAFNGCKSLTGNLVLPENLKKIENYTFDKCSGLNGELIIPNSVTSIGSCAFENCNNFIGDLIIPNLVTEIGDYAFNGCSSLNGRLAIGESVESINYRSFAGTKIESIDFTKAKKINNINKEAFWGISDALVYVKNNESINDILTNALPQNNHIYAITNDGTFDDDTAFEKDRLAIPRNSDHVFDGWYKKDGANDDWGEKVEGNLEAGKTYYAKWTESVAEVGGVEYSSLEKAIKNANGKEVVVKQDIELQDTLKIENNVTINFNDKTVSKKNGDGTIINVTNSANVVIKNANFKSTSEKARAISVENATVTIVGKVNTTVEGSGETFPVVGLIGNKSNIKVEKDSKINKKDIPSIGESKDIVFTPDSGISLGDIIDDIVGSNDENKDILVEEITTNSIKIKEWDLSIKNQVYGIFNKATTRNVSADEQMKQVGDWKEAKDGYVVFDGLSSDTEYTIFVKSKDDADDTKIELVKVTTEKSNTSSGGGNYIPSKPTYTHEKIEGLDRYETAAKIADKLGSYDNVVLVNAESSMSDGLAASGLAGKENGAILLTKKDSIPKATMYRLKKVKKVYIIGGEAAISKKVSDEITKNVPNVKVERLGGKTRIETSEIVAKKLGNYNKAFVVNGFKGEADAMSASSVAAKNGAPILLTNGKTSTHAKKAGVEYYVIGGDTVVDKSITAKYDAEVLAGKDRYATNKEVIDEFYSGRDKIYFANGETLVDALTASTLAKKDGIALVNAKSDKSVLKGKDTVQVGGMKFTIDFDK